MRAPERWPPPEGRRPALVAGILILLAIIGALVWFIATYPQQSADTPASQVPATPPREP